MFLKSVPGKYIISIINSCLNLKDNVQATRNIINNVTGKHKITIAKLGVNADNKAIILDC